jgi:hypothetical protein
MPPEANKFPRALSLTGATRNSHWRRMVLGWLREQAIFLLQTNQTLASIISQNQRHEADQGWNRKVSGIKSSSLSSRLSQFS